jgi:PHO85 cyclin-1
LPTKSLSDFAKENIFCFKSSSDNIISLTSTTMAYPIPTVEQNEAALDYFVQLPVSQQMVTYLAEKAQQVIRCDSATKNSLPTPPTTPPNDDAATDPSLPSVEEFITSIVNRSHVQVPTLMTSLVYLSRLKARLPPLAKGMRCTVHRIFLASLILAAKNLNDSSPKNKHWARYSAVKGFENFGFSITEVNLMEKQLLFLLDWDMRIRPEDLYQHLEPFLAPIRAKIAAKAEEAARVQRQREWEIHNAQLLAAQQAAADLRHSYIYEQHYAHPSQSRSSSRTPSLSPPSRSSSAASAHSDASSISSLGSPDQAYDSYCPSVVGEDNLAARYVADPIKEKPVHYVQTMEQQYLTSNKKPRTAAPGFFSRIMGHGQRQQQAY